MSVYPTTSHYAVAHSFLPLLGPPWLTPLGWNSSSLSLPPSEQWYDQTPLPLPQGISQNTPVFSVLADDLPWVLINLGTMPEWDLHCLAANLILHHCALLHGELSCHEAVTLPDASLVLIHHQAMSMAALKLPWILSPEMSRLGVSLAEYFMPICHRTYIDNCRHIGTCMSRHLSHPSDNEISNSDLWAFFCVNLKWQLTHQPLDKRSVERI